MKGSKDTNLLIMEKLDDESLFNLCLTNKNAAFLCQNEDFWRKRFVSNYGQDVAKYKPKERTWKKH